MQSYTIRLSGAVVRNPQVRLAAPVSVSFRPMNTLPLSGRTVPAKLFW